MMRLSLLFSPFLFMLLSCISPEQEQSGEVHPQRIVSLDATLSETLCALGYGDNIVGVDVTSNYPERLQKLPKVGHVSQLQAEGILSLRPDLLFYKKGSVKTELLNQLSASGLKCIDFDQEYTPDGSKKLMKKVAQKLGGSAKIDSIWSVSEAFLSEIKTLDPRPKMLFIYARGAGNVMVAGKNTPVSALIELAGGENVAKDFSDYKALSPEALMAYQPDAVLLFTSGLSSLEGEEGLLQIPGIKNTPAGKNRAFISMEGQLLTGFGPRLGEAALLLNQELANLHSSNE